VEDRLGEGGGGRLDLEEFMFLLFGFESFDDIERLFGFVVGLEFVAVFFSDQLRVGLLHMIWVIFMCLILLYVCV
jgi:hypothetical protein